MKKSFLLAAAVLTAAVSSEALESMKYPKFRCSDRFDFEKRINLTAYPRTAAKDLSQVDGPYGKAMQARPSKNSVTAYGSMTLKSEGPGTMVVSFDYKFENPSAGKLSVNLNYNLRGKGNGSAGRASDMVTPVGEWTRYRKVFSVPEKAVAVQYVFGISGSGNSVLIDNITVAFTPDKYSVPVARNVWFNDPRHTRIWNVEDAQYGFYSHGKDSTVPALMQVAADKKALYIMICNSVDPAKIKADIKKHDGNLWDNDANEIFLFDEKRSAGWQFIVSANGTAMEAKMYQRVPGDPWRSDASWNGKWQRSGKVTAYGFETRFCIPWATLGIDPNARIELKFNAAADYTAYNEYPTWNAYEGNRMDIGKYGTIVVDNGRMFITRNRVTEKLSYAIERKNPQFANVLQKGVKGNYLVDTWSSGIARNDFPASVMARISDKEFDAWREEMFRAWSVANIGGPSWPWLMAHTRERIVRYHKEHGMKYTFSISNSDHGRAAHRNGGKFIDPTTDWRCDVNEPEYVKAVTGFIRSRKNIADYELMKSSVKYGMGLDEPTNVVELCYNPAVNKNNAGAIKKHSDMVREKFGFGKYGSPFIAGTAAADLPFCRIAFYRWWNSELFKTLSTIQQAFEETFPGIPLLLTDDNNTAGQSNMDVANLKSIAKLISCDPYPTATNACYGMSRAIYHVGFSCRVLKDLVPSARLMVMPQCFIYHGGHGDIDAMREWASQALKNGAEHFMWYCAKAPGQIFKDYADMLELSAMISRMDKVILPEKTSTLVWYSNFDLWAKSDYAQHAPYSVYSILYEHLGSNFKFVSDTSLLNGDVDLNQYKLLYVPQMTYTTAGIAGKISSWVKNGGTLVVFDPLFMSFDIDGSAVAQRFELTGQKNSLKVKTSANDHVMWNGKKLNIAMIANAPALPGSRFMSYTISQGNGKTLMIYGDKKSAVIERKVGCGKVIYFAFQPFAGAELAVTPGAWREFFAMLAKSVNEKTSLPIKDFLLPRPPATVKLKQMIK